MAFPVCACRASIPCSADRLSPSASSIFITIQFWGLMDGLTQVEKIEPVGDVMDPKGSQLVLSGQATTLN